MLFNSFTFVIFLAVVCAFHYAPWFSWRAKKFNLLVASYIFYAAWNPPFVILLWLSTLLDWFAAKGIAKSQDRAARWRVRGWLALSLVGNLGMLGFFKYGNFLLDNFVWLVNQVGLDYHPARADIILPVGISFYTFQTLSYTLDVYRRHMAPSESPLDYAMYVTFFPQLVAGPIIRAVDFLPQCRTERRASRQEFGWGMAMIVVGLFEKVVVADGLLAPVAERLYADPLIRPSCALAWMGTLAFAGQIFCDFAGYSTCAIGVGLCLGFAIIDNFHFPYAAIGFSDFWRRWHISLSSWLRDYLYIPLGGNRRGTVRTYVNLMATMLLGGLWHGASWTFVAWGGLHGLYLMVERLLGQRFGRLAVWSSLPGRLVLAGTTFLLVCFTWVFFRASTFPQAFTILRSMLGLVGQGNVVHAGLQNAGGVTLTMGTMLSLHWALRDTSLEEAASRLPRWLVSVGLAAMLVAIMTMAGDERAFIYFQF